jgi:chromosomal replication initiation ATPase DnaA
MSRMQQLALDLPHRPALGREDFLVADCNADAVAWLDRWPDWPGAALCIHGPAGSGKSHLLEVWRIRSGAGVILGRDLETAGVPGLLAAGAVAVDAADAVRDEAALFHLINLVREQKATLLLTARSAPGHWRVDLPDLRSRLNAISAVGVSSPSDELLASLLRKLFADRQTRVGSDVVDYLVRRMERSFDAAQRIVAECDVAALRGKQAVTVPLVRRILDEADAGR